MFDWVRVTQINKICCANLIMQAAAIYPVPGELQLQEKDNIKLFSTSRTLEL